MIEEVSGDFLQWLRGFYFVVKEGSVRQAAIAMGREKPTITRQIQHLEKELGVTLFDRSSGKMMITPEGKVLWEKAGTLFESIKGIKGEFKEEGNYRGRISIAALPAIIYNILPSYVGYFQRLHPEVVFQLDGGLQEKTCEKVESSEADFGIAFFEDSYKTLLCHYLFEAGMLMIAPKNNPFFSEKGLPTLKQIAETPLILYAHGMLHEPLIERRFAKERLTPKVVQFHNNFVSIKEYVARGMGVAILTEHAVSQEDGQRFDIYNLDRYLPKRKFGILLKRKKYLSPMVKAFLRTIKPDIDFSAILIPAGDG
ncbi:MAG: LysR family transcriptional regulator [Syntrophaceae bacterium]|nr:LysR family transcriptional regulator [Syntrophaceae bacterium]